MNRTIAKVLAVTLMTVGAAAAAAANANAAPQQAADVSGSYTCTVGLPNQAVNDLCSNSPAALIGSLSGILGSLSGFLEPGPVITTGTTTPAPAAASLS